MKTYKLIIELSDSTLDKMTSIEEALKESNSAFALATAVASTALKRRFEKEDSLTVNMDAVVDEKELEIIKRAVVGAGAVGLAQEVRIEEKKEQEQRTLKSNVGSQTSSLYNPNSSYSNPGCAEDSDGGYKLEL